MIALYGHTRGENSFVQVTRGMQRALSARAALAGVVSLEGETAGGNATAPISLNCGNPNGLLLAHRLGDHKEHWLLLAPNGEKIPEPFVESLTAPSPLCPRGLLDGGLLAPSPWAAGVLGKHFDVPIMVAPHGVTPEVHTVRDPQRERARRDYQDGLFYAVHLASGETERKGTRPLFEAWAALKRARKLPERAVLIAVVPSQELSRVRWMGHAARLTDDDLLIAPGFGLSQGEVVATYYAPAHIVCQPSRGEGFGLVPLEAQACGVPTVMTRVTGHAAYVPPEGAPGVVVVRSDGDGPMDDFPGSVAPIVTAEAIAEALSDAYERWSTLNDDAAARADSVREAWAWEHVCAAPIDHLKLRGEKHVRT